MQKPPQHLFVYGTLMKIGTGSLGIAERARLLREARHLGQATMSGAELYDLGEYPGLSDSADASNIVYGEVLELTDPEGTLVWLDDYEGLGPQAEYVRELRRVRCANGRVIDAWVYLLPRAGNSRSRIASGRWAGRP
jgi:gamma-glutamylcyclotransferase (GGCT)/AIG2-like uncharacterized protein YtfP